MNQLHQVLLVEDDPDLREAISVTLTLGKVPFQAFECAEDALDHLSHEATSLLVTDFRLPGMNGLQLLQEARRRNPQLPVVVIPPMRIPNWPFRHSKVGHVIF